MQTDNSVKKWFGVNLAELLADKIQTVYPKFNREAYVSEIEKNITDLGYTQRVELHADILKKLLPEKYSQAIHILTSILGPENPNETGMFTHYYWILPIGKFVEKFGLNDFALSVATIEEITKRNTGEYAIRPYIRAYPNETIAIMKEWSISPNFHLRRLASEGVRPKLPWASKLDMFIENPEPVFEILVNLMQDEVKFVQKSVANNIADYLKVNKPAAVEFMKKYLGSDNKNTQWILKHATRRVKI